MSMDGPEHLQRWTGDGLTGSKDWLRQGGAEVGDGGSYSDKRSYKGLQLSIQNQSLLVS